LATCADADDWSRILNNRLQTTSSFCFFVAGGWNAPGRHGEALKNRYEIGLFQDALTYALTEWMFSSGRRLVSLNTL
jgi:hypothetical protein